MAIDLANKFQPHTDEQFKAESKKSLLTNQDYDWTGAHTIKVYKVSTSEMNDYNRKGEDNGNWSRYGAVAGLDATTEELTLKKDRSFTFAIDKLDEDETAQQLIHDFLFVQSAHIPPKSSTPFVFLALELLIR